MAFKSLKEVNETKYKNMFILRNDGDFADVIFLYKSYNDVLVADVHYIKSAEYSGYVQCIGKGCPACGKNIRIQPKLFIPVYNISKGEVEFWDRSQRFEAQLSADIFNKYPNPSEYVFRITRCGVAGDQNTTYKIEAISKNTYMSMDEVFAKFNLTSPEYYEMICKDYDATKLMSLLNTPDDVPSGNLPNYAVTPRAASTNVPTSVIPPEPSVTSDMLPDDSAELDELEELDEENVNF